MLGKVMTQGVSESSSSSAVSIDLERYTRENDDERGPRNFSNKYACSWYHQAIPLRQARARRLYTIGSKLPKRAVRVGSVVYCCCRWCHRRAIDLMFDRRKEEAKEQDEPPLP